MKLGPQVQVKVEDPDLEVVDMDDLDDVPFEFALPRDRVVDFVEGEDDEDVSLSVTFGSGGQEGPALRSAQLDFPAVMTQAAERVGLPLGASGAAGLRLAPVARYLAVCGGDVVAARQRPQ